jgi:hypothetical protein
MKSANNVVAKIIEKSAAKRKSKREVAENRRWRGAA